MSMLSPILRTPAYSITLLVLLLTGCGEAGTSGPVTDESAQESVTSNPELGSAIPDPFQVVTEIPGEQDSDGNVVEAGSSDPESQTDGDSDVGESEPSLEPESELPEFDENGVPYCD